MNIKRIFDLKRLLLYYIGWNFLFYATFFIGTLSFYFYKQNAHEAQTYQETKKRLKNQLKHIETLLAFVDNRFSHATTPEAQKRILQDRYNTSIGGKSYPKIFNIYHIQNFHIGTSIGAYGKITLEQLPSADFFETLLDSNQKMSIRADEKYFNIFSPSTSLLTNQKLPTFLMIKVPLEDLFGQGVSLSKHTQTASPIVFPEYNMTFFFSPRKANLIKEYANIYWPYFLLMILLTSLFALYLVITRKQVKAEIFDRFRSQLTVLKNRDHEQTAELSLLQEDLTTG